MFNNAISPVFVSLKYPESEYSKSKSSPLHLQNIQYPGIYLGIIEETTLFANSALKNLPRYLRGYNWGTSLVCEKYPKKSGILYLMKRGRIWRCPLMWTSTLGNLPVTKSSLNFGLQSLLRVPDRKPMTGMRSVTPVTFRFGCSSDTNSNENPDLPMAGKWSIAVIRQELPSKIQTVKNYCPTFYTSIQNFASMKIISTLRLRMFTRCN